MAPTPLAAPRARRHGPGTLSYANGDVFEGSWAHDKKHGHGTHFYMARGKR
jgi:hypothetical protein